MRNILLDKLQLKYPIIQGGMANIATAELASAVTKAGGLGLIGSGGWTPEQTKEQIIQMQEFILFLNQIIIQKHVFYISILQQIQVMRA